MFSSHFQSTVMIFSMMFAPRLAILLMISLYDGTLAVRRRQTTQGYRLPETIVPRKYTLEIFTNLEEDDFSFQGKVLIKVKENNFDTEKPVVFKCRG